MDIPINEHANRQHTGRSLLDDVARMLDADEYTRATCSFPRREWRDVLASEVMRLEEAIFELWRSDQYGQRRIAISHTFDDDDARRLQVPTTYVGIYADEMGVLRFATTRTISVVLDRVRDGIELYNAFPNMSQRARTPLEGVGILPYAQQTDRWKTANLSRRTYYRMKCQGGIDVPISWDESTSQMWIPIVEDGTQLGRVLIGMSAQMWDVTGDELPIVHEHRAHAKLLSRAFPTTLENVRTIERARQDELTDTALLATSSSVVALPDLCDRYCKVPPTPAAEDAPEKKAKDRPKRSRGKARAQRRSKAANEGANRKSRRKAAKRPRDKAKERPTESRPFQFKRVMTKFEEFGLDQDAQNGHVLRLALSRYAILANDAEDECLVPGPMLSSMFDDVQYSLCHVPMTLAEASAIADALDRTCDMDDNGDNILYPDAMTLDAIMTHAKAGRIRTRHAKDSRVTKLLDAIAQDPHWHIVLPSCEMDHLRKMCHDSLDRPIERVCNDHAPHVSALGTFPDDFLRPPYVPTQAPAKEEGPAPRQKATKLATKGGDIVIGRLMSPSDVIRAHTDATRRRDTQLKKLGL